MTDIVKGMTREYERVFLSSTGEDNTREDAMRAALLWQAENASEEIAKHLCRTVHGLPADEPIPAPMLDAMTWRVAAAIRATAGEP